MKRTRRFGVVVVAAATASVLPTIESTATAPTAVSFAPVAAYASDTQPWGIATADFDRDGDIDVVTGNRFGDSVSVHPSNGDGTFAARTDMDIPDAGNNPGDFGAANVATGDLNRDGNPDIVASAKVSGTLSVFLGNGAGGFAARTDYAVCSDPMGVALADFDRDGDLDVATAGNGNLCVYDGDGAGGIGAATGVGAFPSRGVVTGDFDRDGDLDLAAVEVNANAQVALNDGTGNFGAPTAYAATPLGFSWAITTADYNGDAILDLAVGNQEGDNVSVLAGVGDGTFAARTDYAVGNRPHAIASGDFNRDGAIDIATGNTHTDDVSILVGDGAGTFSPAVHVAVGNDPEALAIADFDRDGAPDVASINASGGFLEILLNTVPGGGGNFNTKIDFATGASPRAMATADFDRDGNIDVATVNPFDDTVRVGLGAGDGNVAAPSVFATGDAPDRVAVGDLNRDGREDLVVTNGLGDSVSVLLANGPATFAAKTDVAVGDSPGPVVMGDFNRDAKLDVAAASENGGGIAVLLGDGAGGLAPAVTRTVSTNAHDLVTTDIDRDGDLDLLAAAGSSTGYRVDGDGSGGFAADTPLNGSVFATVIATGDVDRDGDEDVLLAGPLASSLHLVRNNAGTMAPSVTFAAGNSIRDVVVGDVNRDGTLDAAVVNLGDDTVSVLRGTGVPGSDFAARKSYPAGDAPLSLAAVRMNGDDLTDLVLTRFGGGGSVLLSSTNEPPTAPGTPALTAGATPNGDGSHTLGWDAATDADADPLTYALEHKDADDADWSSVASGVSGTSHAVVEGEGTWTYRVKANDNIEDGPYSSASSTVVVDRSAPNAPTLSITSGQAAVNVSGTDWYKDTVSVDVTPNGDVALADGSAGSGVDSSSYLSPFSVTTNGNSSVTGTVADLVGNVSADSAPLTVNVDALAPSVAIPSCPSSPLTLGSSASITVLASDGESGLAVDPSGTPALDTSTVGAKTYTATALDNVGHETSTTCDYVVAYGSSGFFSPLPRSEWGAGATIPVKFALLDGNGSRISDSSAQAIASTCRATVSFTAGPVSPTCFKYDAKKDMFQIEVKTPRNASPDLYTITATVMYGTTPVTVGQVDVILRRK